jgi:hypothetical protein
MEWKRDEAKYACGELLLLGAWNVGGIHYDSRRTRDEPLEYAATCKLPGIKGNLGYFTTKSEAKAKVEKAVTHWLSKLPSNAEITGSVLLRSPG